MLAEIPYLPGIAILPEVGMLPNSNCLLWDLERYSRVDVVANRTMSLAGEIKRVMNSCASTLEGEMRSIRTTHPWKFEQISKCSAKIDK